MGHKYVKEEDTFSTSQNGTVPKPTAQEISDGKVLGANGQWVANSGGGGSSTLAGLSDVSLVTPSDGQALVFDSDDDKWKNAGILMATVGNDKVPFRFHYDSTTQKYGYLDGADTFHPFNDNSGNAERIYMVSQERFRNAATSSNGVLAGNWAQGVHFATRAQGNNNQLNSFYNDGNNNYCFYTGQAGNRDFTFLTKIPQGVYSKLYIDIASGGSTGQYNLCNVTLNSTGILLGYMREYQGTNYRFYHLVNYSSTPAAINAQTGIIINSTSQYSLSRQVVEIDISDVEGDFYVCMHECDNWMKIYDMYVE